VEGRFLVLPLALFAFRGLSGAPTAALTAPAVVDTTSFPASTFALAASITISCADFAVSMAVLTASAVASCVALKTPSPSSIVAPFRESVRKSHIQIRTRSIQASKKPVQISGAAGGAQ
jgi:hypothetical protein